jgi:hypothetical protein
MKKHLNLMTLLMLAVAIAALLGHLKGITMFGFSSGG